MYPCIPLYFQKIHHLTTLIINYLRITHLDAGHKLLRSSIAQHFWIMFAGSVIRACIFKCIAFISVKPSRMPLPLARNLPRDRVTPASPIAKTGVDFASPFLCKKNNILCVERKRSKCTYVYLYLSQLKQSESCHGSIH